MAQHVLLTHSDMKKAAVQKKKKEKKCVTAWARQGGDYSFIRVLQPTQRGSANSKHQCEDEYVDNIDMVDSCFSWLIF